MNPITRITTWMDNVAAQKDTGQAVAPVNNNQTVVLPESETAKDAEVVSGQFVPDQVIAIPSNNAQVHTERLRRTIASFNEDKQTPLKWLVVKFFEVLSYLLP